MSDVIVFHDGKMCRAQKGRIIARQSNRIKIEYYNSWMEQTVKSWFIRARRENGGAYEDRNGNYWYYPRASKTTE